MSDLWSEKYRVRRAEDLLGGPEGAGRIKQFVKQGHCPHLLIVGPSGSGKTSAMQCLARHFATLASILEMNASDARGVDVMRSAVKDFVERKSSTIKFVLLDEADVLSVAAQQAVADLIDVYSSTTRFLLACNDANALTDALQSRCTLLPFDPVAEHEMGFRLQQVAVAEGIPVLSEATLKALIFVAEGDMRKALSAFQSAVNFVDVVREESKRARDTSLSPEQVYAIADQPHPVALQHIVQSCQEGKTKEARARLDELWSQGFQSADVIDALCRVLKTSRFGREETRVLFLTAFAKMLHRQSIRGVEGDVTLTQIYGLIGEWCLITEKVVKKHV